MVTMEIVPIKVHYSYYYYYQDKQLAMELRSLCVCAAATRCFATAEKPAILCCDKTRTVWHVKSQPAEHVLFLLVESTV